jgi:hypothetical protein
MVKMIEAAIFAVVEPSAFNPGGTFEESLPVPYKRSRNLVTCDL